MVYAIGCSGVGGSCPAAVTVHKKIQLTNSCHLNIVFFICLSSRGGRRATNTTRVFCLNPEAIHIHITEE